jgi:ABC-2 type transport system ATP-binding protein
LIQARGLSKRYGDRQALKGVSFEVREREVYGLLGPNGAGKSTTIGILAGLIIPDTGQTLMNGLDIAVDPLTARQNLGVVPQALALYGDLTARENLMFFGRLYGLPRKQLRDRVDELLKRVDLLDRADELVQRFSGGMQRRLNVAAGLVHRPRVVLLDEPTVGLDPQTRLAILELVQAIAREGASVLYTTHYLDEAERLCDRVAIMDHGRLLLEGETDELLQAAGEREIVALRGRFNVERVPSEMEEMDEVELIKAGQDELLFSLLSARRGLSSLLELAARVGELREVAIKQPSLESLFIKLTGREIRD